MCSSIPRTYEYDVDGNGHHEMQPDEVGLPLFLSLLSVSSEESVSNIGRGSDIAANSYPKMQAALDRGVTLSTGEKTQSRPELPAASAQLRPPAPELGTRYKEE